jgi:predicted transcriptional regulator
MSEPLGTLSRCEWELMLLCWRLGRPTAREVHTASLKRRVRDYRTVLATLNNVAAKGFLAVRKEPGPRNIPTNRYVPIVARSAATERRIRSFLSEDLEWDAESLDLLSRLVADHRAAST